MKSPSQTSVGTVEYHPVLTKKDFAYRYFLGEFGNHSPTWTSWKKFYTEGRQGPLYHLRNGAVAGGRTWYRQTWEQALMRWVDAERPEDWYCSMQVPPDVEKSLLLQGEVQRGLWGLDLYYTRVPLPMRDALRQESHSCNGATALYLLTKCLCPNSYDWVMELLDRYPDHVVEFSSYGINWGTLPNFNTIVWEVRYY